MPHFHFSGFVFFRNSYLSDTGTNQIGSLFLSFIPTTFYLPVSIAVVLGGDFLSLSSNPSLEFLILLIFSIFKHSFFISVPPSLFLLGILGILSSLYFWRILVVIFVFVFKVFSILSVYFGLLLYFGLLPYLKLYSIIWLYLIFHI